MSENRLVPSCGADASKLYVFRDGRHPVSGATLASNLADALRAIPSSASAGDAALMDALLRAGEFETALADFGHPAALPVSCITDGLACMLLGHAGAPSPATLLAHVPSDVAEELHVSAPEGFAYYALHPHDFAKMVDRAPLRSHHALVVGIRTIGGTLSAVVAAALRKRGKHVRRITVRPHGHAYDRHTNFDEDQQRLICQYRNLNADFLIADEGPGMSGSSFLSVADALAAARVPRDRITLLCSREPDVKDLRAADAQERWLAHHALYVGHNHFLPADASIYAGAGTWRSHVFGNEADWPESWLHMERLKFFSADQRKLSKFEGYGRYGAAVHERACKLADSGFGPPCEQPQAGFGVYPIVPGRMLRREELSPELVRHIARYCAFRLREFAVARTTDAPTLSNTLEEMARYNFNLEFGRDLDLPSGALATSAPIIADARVQPHEWLLADDGRVLKLDGTTHGDDHFFPGPTDIAWDLAGAIVEWDMDAGARELLLEEYNGTTGDNASRRVDAFIAAYSVFRMAYCKMAASAVGGSGEEHRLHRAYERYREFVARATGAEGVAAMAEQQRAEVSAVPLLSDPSPAPLAA